MKRTVSILVFSFLILFSLMASAGRGHSKLELRLWNNAKFFVEIDNQTYPDLVRKFKINRIESGRHYIKVIKSTQRHNGFFNQVVYRGFIQIPARSKVVAKITHTHVFDIIKIKSLGHNHSYGHGYNSHGGSVHGNTGINSHGTSDSYGYNTGMYHNTFIRLKDMVRNTAFDSKKLVIIKQAIAPGRIRSEQVLELMEMMTFDSNRLELAKFAYRYTTDKQSYFIVNEAFVFSSNISALNHYIGSFMNI